MTISFGDASVAANHMRHIYAINITKYITAYCTGQIDSTRGQKTLKVFPSPRGVAGAGKTFRVSAKNLETFLQIVPFAHRRDSRYTIFSVFCQIHKDGQLAPACASTHRQVSLQAGG